MAKLAFKTKTLEFEITPEQFIEACTPEELFELEIALINKQHAMSIAKKSLPKRPKK